MVLLTADGTTGQHSTGVFSFLEEEQSLECCLSPGNVSRATLCCRCFQSQGCLRLPCSKEPQGLLFCLFYH